ncbi:MAG: SPOR domain-containing protein [Bdellovibrionota bacterium]|nr:SPOR domain-containing protein [Bdellovibrionota bacterium]
MLNEQGRSRMDTVIKLALVFIISLLSFSIGTFVGKQFSDQQHKTAMIEGDGGQARSTASIPTNTLEVAPEEALTDADIASITEEFANAEKDDIDELLAEVKSETKKADTKEDSKPAKEETAKASAEDSIDAMMAEVVAEEEPKKEMAKTETTTKKEMPKTLPEKDDMVSEVAKNITQDVKPVVKDKPQKSRIPTSLPAKVAASTVGKFTIQVAAYQSEKEAKEHAENLTNQGYSSFYLKADVKGNTWFRVNVGLFANKEKAGVYRKQLMKEASLKSALVKKIVQ